MALSDLSIRRPVFAWMLMLGLIVFGAVSFSRLGISQLPDVDFPVINVGISWQGAAPEVMESEIVDPMEQSLVSIEGIREISSSIRQGQVNISLEFDLKRNVDAALQEIQSAVSRVRLPQDADLPIVRKNNPEDQPIMWLGISAPDKSLRELIELVELSVKDQFEILPGVGEVLLGGYTERNLRVWADNSKLKKYELSILDIQNALESGQIETAAGVIENDKQEMNLRFMGEGINPDQVGEILIPSRGGRPIFGTEIHLKDVATIEDGLNDIRRISRIQGKPGIGLGIKKQRGANTVAIGEAVKAKMEDVQKLLPAGVDIALTFDTTVFVKESVEESEFTLVLSAIVTSIVCFFFLGSLRPTFNILLSIPTSIIGTFIVVYFMGFTLNLFTILGLALAIGIVVDDAIMVLENIYRHKALGKDRVTASLDGSREITFAAMSATLAVIAIFLPVAFMQGIIGKFFFQFGVTISAAVALSLLEAITLTPMRCSQMMEDNDQNGFLARILTAGFLRFSGWYRSLLAVALRWRWLVLLASLAIFIGSLKLTGVLRKEFLPAQDQSTFITRIETPAGSSLAYTSDAIKQVESYFIARKDVRRVFVAVGGFGGGEVNTGVVFVSLVPPNQRQLTQDQIIQDARKNLSSLKQMKVFIQDLSTRGFTAQRGFPVEINIRGPDWNVLDQKSKEIQAELDKSGLAVDLNTDYRLGQPEIRVWPIRAAALERGVSVESIGSTVSAAIGGVRQGKFTQGGRRYDVRLRLKADERIKPEDIMALDIRNTHGELVPISEVSKIEQVATLQTITRRNRERSISIYGNVSPGASQSAALDKAVEIATKILPPGYRVFLSGGAQTFKESFESLFFVLWLGIIVAYMVLASQFNSYVQPLVVLLSLPFSLTGAFFALYLADQSLNLYSLIGLVLLMGIVKKNGILLVEFTNHKRFVDGLNVEDAILEASPIRLRPILMTSIATLAAAIPPALALGPGAESRVPMAITVIGGVLVSTVFTLFVVPCAYRVMSRNGPLLPHDTESSHGSHKEGLSI